MEAIYIAGRAASDWKGIGHEVLIGQNSRSVFISNRLHYACNTRPMISCSLAKESGDERGEFGQDEGMAQ